MLLQNINSVPFMAIKYRVEPSRDVWGNQVRLDDGDIKKIMGVLPACQRKEVLSPPLSLAFL